MRQAQALLERANCERERLRGARHAGRVAKLFSKNWKSFRKHDQIAMEVVAYVASGTA
jgi:hypothetical protein